jgi:hemerythrin
MRHKGNDFYSMGWEISEKQQKDVFDFVEQLMHADTKEGLVKNILLLYQIVGEHFWEEDEMMKNHGYPHYPTRSEAQGYMFDKLIELSYIIHQDKWRKRGMGVFKKNWSTQPVPKDDLDFERYLANLKSS